MCAFFFLACARACSCWRRCNWHWRRAYAWHFRNPRAAQFRWRWLFCPTNNSGKKLRLLVTKSTVYPWLFPSFGSNFSQKIMGCYPDHRFYSENGVIRVLTEISAVLTICSEPLSQEMSNVLRFVDSGNLGHLAEEKELATWWKARTGTSSCRGFVRACE